MRPLPLHAALAGVCLLVSARGLADADPCQATGPLTRDGSAAAYSQLAVCDDFVGAGLDPQLWRYNYPAKGPNQWRQDIGGLHEHNFPAYLDESLVGVGGGELVLSAANRRHPAASPRVRDEDCRLWQMQGNTCEIRWSTGAISSKFELRYGYIEARIRLPDTNGFWPAFWLAARDTWPPEIDVFELRTDLSASGGRDYKLNTSYHYGPDWQHHYSQARFYNEHGDSSAFRSYFCPREESLECFAKLHGWHVYAVDWQPQLMRFLIDGEEVFRVGGAQITDQGMFLMLDLGVGGWALDPNAATDWQQARYEVDWVRVWAHPGERVVVPSHD